MHLYLCGIFASHTKTGQFELWKDSQSENFGKVNKNLLHVHLHGLELCFYFYCIERDTFFEDFSRTVSQTNFNPQIAFYMTIRKTYTDTYKGDCVAVFPKEKSFQSKKE